MSLPDPDPPAEPIDKLDPPTEPRSERRVRRWWTLKRVWIPTVVLAACGLLYAADLLLAGDEVPRNTSVGDLDLSGLSRDAAAALLEGELAGPVGASRDVVAGSATGRINSGAAGVALDVAGSVAVAARQPLDPFTRLMSLFSEREVPPVLVVDGELLDGALAEFAATTDRPPVEGAITFEGIQAVAVDPVPGVALDRRGAATAFVDAVRADPGQRAPDPIELPVEEIPVTITAEEVQDALDTIAAPALAAPIIVNSPAGSSPAGASVEIPVTAIAASLRFTPDADGKLAPSIDPTALSAATGQLFAPLTTPPQDAGFEITGGMIRVVPSLDGTGIDMALLSAALVDVLTQPAPRQVDAPLGAAPAALTTEAANALGITEVVSTFTTNYTSSASGQNMKVVAADVNGAIVLPGEAFSLNGFTGPRTEAQGYVPAGVIISGEFQTAVGGGVSQFATTTFNAVFFAGLEDIYHKPHSYYISRYPPGREATVFYDSVDLVFRNDQPTGIYIETAWAPGSLTVTFWGTKQVDVESVSSERRNFRDPETQEKPDDGTCAASSGSTGFDITVTRVFKQLGTETVLRTEDFVTRYNAQPRVVCVPPVAPPGLISPDQGPAARTNTNAQVHNRRLGRSRQPAFC